jgi:hypothetical protein
MNKHFSSPVGTALHRADKSLATTPLEIETEFTDYLKTLAEPPPPHFQSAHDADFTKTPIDPRLEHLLALTNENEVLRNIRDSPSDSASRTLHPVPLLLATYNLGWSTPEISNEPTHMHVKARKDRVSVLPQDTIPIPRTAEDANTTTPGPVIHTPQAGPFIIAKMVNLCLLARDLPRQPKKRLTSHLVCQRQAVKAPSSPSHLYDLFRWDLDPPSRAS